MRIDRTGIRLNGVGRGWVSLPWDAVGSVHKDVFGRLVVKPAEGVGPATPGTHRPDDRSTARRIRRWGFKLGAVITPDATTVVSAVHHFSGGRL